MIKLRMTNSRGTAIIGIGLSAENIRLLQQGKPAMFELQDLGIDNTKMFIIAGDTEASIKEDLWRLGFAGDGL